MGKPVLPCDPFAPDAANRIREWLKRLGIHTLNVAGPAESAAPGIGERTFRALVNALDPRREL
jgi:hypothetical protein